MNVLVEMAMDLLVAWRENRGISRVIIIISVIFGILAALTASVGRFFIYPEYADGFMFAFSGLAAILAFSVVAFVRSKRHEVQREKIEAVEKRAEENPDEPRAAWDLARTKLESYLDRNLSQVRSIFWLTVVVMLAGFGLIGYGIAKVFESPENLNPSIVSAISGVLVSFIGATILTVYRSTMAQAKNYVSILERINAVGMSIQVLETISEQAEGLKDQTTASIAKQLLEMYTKTEVL